VGLIVAVAIVAVLAVVSVSWFVVSSMKKGDTDFSVGKCVQQDGGSAVVVDCSTEGAFRIASTVDSEAACEDVHQPWLVVTDANGATSYRCLVPAAG
jgi:hypothetical protein